MASTSPTTDKPADQAVAADSEDVDVDVNDNDNTGDNDTGVTPASFLLVDDPKPRKGIARLGVDRILGWELLKMALPVVLGMVTQTAINILDGAMVGQLPKAEANPGQAAIGLALPFMWMVGGFLSAVWVGTQALTSRRAGEGNDLLAGRVLTNSLLISVIGSISFSLVAIWITPPVVRALYKDPTVVAYAIDYLQIRYIGILAMVGTFSLKSFFDGIGKTSLFMIAAVVMNLMNVLLNFWLIYGHEGLGIPRMGVSGAAWASVISAYIGFGLLTAASFSPRLVKRYRYYRLKNIHGQVINSIMKLSLPNGAATIVVMLGFSAFYWVVGRVNDMQAVAGNPVILTAKDVVVWATMPSFMTSLAFGSATAAIVSQALGARRSYLAERYTWEAVKLWAYVMWVFGALMFIWPDATISIFNSDPEIIAAARTPLRMVAAPHGMIAMALILTQTLYGVGDAKFVMMVELLMHLFVMSPAAYFFAIVLDYGLNGVWMGPLLYMGMMMVIMFWKFLQNDWKKIEI